VATFARLSAVSVGLANLAVLAGLFALNGLLFPKPSTILQGIVAALMSGLVGAAFGLGLGLAEGLVLAFPIAAILGLFRSRG
jgi:hypothetical protein